LQQTAEAVVAIGIGVGGGAEGIVLVITDGLMELGLGKAR